MPNTAHPFNDELLESLLAGNLALTAAAKLELHLEVCADCRNRLDQLAAKPEEWEEARERFTDSELMDGISSRVGAERERRSGALTIMEYLAPTDDPHMMGRLGAYEIAGIVGAGGMGVVLKGFDRALNRFVAIKVLGPHLATSATARKRFSREAQAAAAVVHDNIVAIHGVSEANGLPYLVMPYIRGQSLQRRLDQRGTLALVEVLRIGYQIASGLSAAHSQGLVHRDIKPANILLEEGVERLRITDFGLARAIDDATLTQEGTLAGTPEYMSPEQARAETVGPASDLFSLGSVLFAACTGRPPFRGDTSYGVLRRITDSTPPPIPELNADIPNWLDAIVVKLLSKEPNQRFASAEEVAKLFQDCLGHVQRPTVFPLPATAKALVLKTTQPRGMTTSARLLGIAPAVCVLCVLGLLTYWMGPGNQTPDHENDAQRSAGSHPVTAVPAVEQPALSFNPTPINIPIEVGYVRGLTFSADGRWIAAGWSSHTEVTKSNSGAVAIWDVANRQQAAVYPLQSGVFSLAFSPGGMQIAIGNGQGKVTVLDRETGKILFAEAIGTGDTAVRFSPKGTLLAAGSQSGSIVLWNASSLEKHSLTFEGDSAPVLTVCFSADESKLAVGGGYFPPEKVSGTARVWELASGNRLATLPHSAAVMDIAFSGDGSQLATASLDARARLWNLRSSEVESSYRDSDSGLVGVKFLKGEKGIATLGPRSGIKFWNMAAERPRETISVDGSHWTALAQSPDGTLIASGGHDRRIQLWSASTAAAVAELKLRAEGEPAQSPILALAVSIDGQRMAVAREDGGLLVRDMRTNQILRHFVPPLDESGPEATRRPGSPVAIAFSKTGGELISGGRDGCVRVWDISSGNIATLVQAHSEGIDSLAISPDGSKLATGSADHEAAIWEYPSGRELRRWNAHESAVGSVAFFPTGDRILSIGADGQAKVWRLENGDLLASCDAHSQPIFAAAISPDGQTIATGGQDGQLLLWSARTGLDRRSLPRQKEAVRRLQFSSNGRAIVSGGDDCILRVWDTTALAQRQFLTAHAKPFTGLSFAGTQSNDLITAGADGTAKVWKVAEERHAATSDDRRDSVSGQSTER